MKSFFPAIILLIFSGCSNISALLTLKELGDSQKNMERAVDQGRRGFDRLSSDIKNGKLRPGRSSSWVRANYGEPVLIKHVEAGDGSCTSWLYRYPVQYFGEKAYLYFDCRDRLTGWSYEPKASPSR